MLMCASCEGAYGEVFNLGSDHASNFRELAETVVRVAGSGRWEFAPFIPERAAQEPGDYQSDIR
jgi:UDP-glucose 4-epimerase